VEGEGELGRPKKQDLFPSFAFKNDARAWMQKETPVGNERGEGRRRRTEGSQQVTKGLACWRYNENGMNRRFNEKRGEAKGMENGSGSAEGQKGFTESQRGETR